MCCCPCCGSHVLLSLLWEPCAAVAAVGAMSCCTCCFSQLQEVRKAFLLIMRMHLEKTLKLDAQLPTQLCTYKELVQCLPEGGTCWRGLRQTGAGAGAASSAAWTHGPGPFTFHSFIHLCPVVFSMEEQSNSAGKELQHRTRAEVPGKKSWQSQAYTLGAISNFMSTFLTFPIYKVVFRQQIHAVAVSEAVRQLWHEGPQYFYRGIYPPLLSKTLQGTLLFGTYDSLLCFLSPVGPHSLGQRWTAGLMSGVVEAIALSPFERVQNVLQDARKQACFPSTFSILKEFNSYGLWGRLSLGYYRGFWPVLVRNSLGSALYFSFKDPIQDGLARQGLPHWVPALVSGSVNGTITCLILYPLIVLVANMQSHIGWQRMPSLWASAQDVWDTRGRKILLIYRGGSLIVLRSSVTWGLTTAIHDFLQRKAHTKKEMRD
ncbi:solute carrier family 25 member 53 [Mastomys coucha]|uniref:solute carrier family 25 member 53 n=1 Tax=Mastomys coucha TaxID=35658 RepID=UPI0012625578|nr:solute carrier family 25 member 53 [Mastomys coucha]